MEQNMISYSRVALIPAYKPMDLLPELVAALWNNGLEVVVVNDGSGAEFDDVFRACSAYADICVHAVNQGKGTALKTGLAYILEKYGENVIAVTVDADGQHAVKDALAVCALAEQNPHKLIFGSRRFTGKVPFRSRFGNTLTEVAYHIFSGVKMYDTQTGLRAFSGDLIPKLLAISGKRYEYEINMLFGFTKQGIDIIEHEIETIYDNNNSSSHFNPVRDTLRLHKQIWKNAAYSFVSVAVEYLLFALLWSFTGFGCVLLANAVARAVSSSLRFGLNRKYGFKSRSTLCGSLVRYIPISLGVLLLNTAAVFCMSIVIQPLVAKLLVMMIGFVATWLVKKIVVSRRKAKKA